MDPALAQLLAAAIAFVGTHFALSHPLRAPLVSRIGEGPFLGLYSLVAAATLGWTIVAFRAAPAADIPGATGDAGWVSASLLTIPALLLFLGSLWKNPALPNPGAANTIDRAATGVFAVTRHPMMWGFALWALAHLLLGWSWRTTIVSVAVGFLALVGAHLQDRKKEALLGAAWAEWEAKTSYWPRWQYLFRAGWALWAVTLLLWLVITWSHIHAAGVPAGIWRWLS
ncbi:NnrU family protein [Tsuneonella sp. YG55]|uniref:NnrU family protein n=1 Tax=Tsuneonella litorea TaxID=2976475 RepID=A0A9X2W2R7_9SPHN|nr:NnrU family protein [Tsuneonella litorea]MCT2559913.1 NnrU family protein [Tsuneonella litorea]